MSETYLSTIERFFVLLRGRGVMLSAADVELVLQWQEAGFSEEVVCRGLSAAAERLRERNGQDEPLPSSLAYYRHFVEEAAEARRDISPSQLCQSLAEELTLHTDDSGDEGAAPPAGAKRGDSYDEGETPAVLRDAASDLAWIERMERDPALAAAWAAAREAIEELGPDADPDYALSLGDRAAVDALLERIDGAARESLEQVVAERLRREAAGLGRRALAMRRRALLEDEVHERFGLMRLHSGGRHG